MPFPATDLSPTSTLYSPHSPSTLFNIPSLTLLSIFWVVGLQISTFQAPAWIRNAITGRCVWSRTTSQCANAPRPAHKWLIQCADPTAAIMAARARCEQWVVPCRRTFTSSTKDPAVSVCTSKHHRFTQMMFLHNNLIIIVFILCSRITQYSHLHCSHEITMKLFNHSSQVIKKGSHLVKYNSAPINLYCYITQRQKYNTQTYGAFFILRTPGAFRFKYSKLKTKLNTYLGHLRNFLVPLPLLFISSLLLFFTKTPICLFWPLSEDALYSQRKRLQSILVFNWLHESLGFLLQCQSIG